MPTSTYAHLSVVASYLEHARPQSVLDIGLGNGKMGYIARDALDVMLGQRYRPEEWQIRIDGIEVFGDYIRDHQRAIYDAIHIGDAFEVIDRLGVYDMIIVGDVLEHFEPERARQFMTKCAAHARHWIMLNIPLGEAWTQPDIYGNEYERHRSFWSPDDFEPVAAFSRYFPFAIGQYGSFLIPASNWCHTEIWQRADALAAAGQIEAAIAGMERDLSTCGPLLASEVRLVELHVRAGMLTRAMARLQATLTRFPPDEGLERLANQLRRLAASDAA